MFFWKIYKRILKLLAKNLPGYQIRRAFLSAAGYAIGKEISIGEDLTIDVSSNKGHLHAMKAMDYHKN